MTSSARWAGRRCCPCRWCWSSSNATVSWSTCTAPAAARPPCAASPSSSLALLTDPAEESPDIDRMDRPTTTISSTPICTCRSGRWHRQPGAAAGTSCSLARPVSSAHSCCTSCCARPRGRIYCLVRAADEAEGRPATGAAAKFELPEPDPARVRVVPGDLRDIAEASRQYRDGELAERIGHVLHCAAKVVFTEPYRIAAGGQRPARWSSCWGGCARAASVTSASSRPPRRRPRAGTATTGPGDQRPAARSARRRVRRQQVGRRAAAGPGRRRTGCGSGCSGPG